MSRELSLELYDEIISYLWNNKQALLACSVAGRILTVPSQKRLFSRVILPGPHHNERHPSKTHQLGQSYSDFKRLLNRSPHIVGYIECLQIIATSKSTECGFDNEKDSEGDAQPRHSLCYWFASANALPACEPHFHKLKALVVDCVGDWYRFCPRIRSIISRLLRLPSLVYVALKLFPIPILTQAIGDNVKHFRFRGYWETNNKPLPTSTPAVPIYLESMYITHVQSLLSFMLTDPNCRIRVNQLRKVVFNMSNDELEAHPMTWALLRSCADTLEELTIVPSQSVCDLDVIQYQEETDLAKLTSLRKIEVWIDYHDDPYGEGYIHNFGWFTQLLLSCSSSNERLEEMTIITNVASWEIIDLGLWKEITSALVGVCFLGLKKLNIVFAHGFDINISLMNVEAFKESEHISKLHSQRGLDVNVIGRIDSKEHRTQFAPDPRWEILNDRWL